MLCELRCLSWLAARQAAASRDAEVRWLDPEVAIGCARRYAVAGRRKAHVPDGQDGEQAEDSGRVLIIVDD